MSPRNVETTNGEGSKRLARRGRDSDAPKQGGRAGRRKPPLGAAKRGPSQRSVRRPRLSRSRPDAESVEAASDIALLRTTCRMFNLVFATLFPYLAASASAPSNSSSLGA